MITGTGLPARFAGACPLGVVLRPVRPVMMPPFPTRPFHPPYLPAGMDIALAGTAPHEPFLAVISFGGRPGATRPDRAQPVGHPAGPRDITQVRIAGPWPEPRSAPLTAIAAVPGCALAAGAAPHAVVTLDGGPVIGNSTYDRTPP